MPFRRFRRQFFRKPISVGMGNYLSGIITAISVAALLVVLIKLIISLESILVKMATIEAGNVATAAINETISEYMSAGSLKYSEFISLEKKNSGEIAAITTDVLTVNAMQAELTKDIIERISTLSSDLSIPLGSVLGINILGGRGPGIPVRVAALSGTSADITGEFISSGINQTKHQIILEITADISILVPGGMTTDRVTTEILIAETVVMGSVPDSYISLGDFAG